MMDDKNDTQCVANPVHSACQIEKRVGDGE